MHLVMIWALQREHLSVLGRAHVVVYQCATPLPSSALIIYVCSMLDDQVSGSNGPILVASVHALSTHVSASCQPDDCVNGVVAAP